MGGFQGLEISRRGQVQIIAVAGVGLETQLVQNESSLVERPQLGQDFGGIQAAIARFRGVLHDVVDDLTQQLETRLTRLLELQSRWRFRRVASLLPRLLQ